MKNRLFYLVGTALLMCSTGMFTSCINGVDDEYLEQAVSGGEGGTDNEEDDSEDMNGEYFDGGDFGLKMTYNGEELTGKKVTFMLNEDQKSATVTLAGTEKDLASLSNLLQGMDATFTTYSPIPGEKEVLFNNVKVYKSGSDCIFEGESTKPNYKVSFKGQILDAAMTIDIEHVLAREENNILGKWKMGAVKEAGSGDGFLAQAELLNNNDNDFTKSSPLFLNWGTDKKVDMGRVPTGMEGALATIEVNRPMNGIFNLLMSQLVTSQLIKPSLEQALPKLIEYIAAEETGGMYASYSWNGAENPIYSQDMSHNIVRYYFDADNTLRIEANADYLLTVLGGLLGGSSTRVTTRDAQPDNTKIIGKELVNTLRPALEKGFPCEYNIDDNNNMTINIDGQLLLDVMKLVEKLVNDEFAKPMVDEFVNSIGDYAPNVKLLLANLHNALGDDCKYIKLGFHMVKIESAPEVTE